jgi:hypothetical protein
MNGKFIVYALAVSLLSTGVSWTKMLRTSSGSSNWGSGYSGSSWSSNTGSGGGSWGGGAGGHK